MSNMASQLPASTPPAFTNSTYGFFKTFPRELRDAMYDLLYQEVTTNVNGLRFHTRTAMVEFRLISRQFRLEYDERSAVDKHNNMNHLTITDDEEFELGHWIGGEPWGVAMRCPALATRTTSLTLNLIACLGKHQHEGHPSCDDDTKWHVIWINSLLKSLPHIRHIYVRLDIVSPGCISAAPKSVGFLEALPQFADLKIVGVESLQSIGSTDDSVLLATWTKQHGLQEDHEAIELYRKRQADIITTA